MRILLLGANGMLGKELQIAFADQTVISWDFAELDITQRAMVLEKIPIPEPSIIINAAAYTAVDQCETQEEIATRVNGDAVGYLAEAATSLNIPIVHFSTDYVFAGDVSLGYAEDAPRKPLNAYGRSKAVGEERLEQSGATYYLIRTSWLYGKHGKNFVDTMLRLADEKEELRVVNDQHGKPTFARDLAQAVVRLTSDTRPSGIYHITNEGETTWYDFAKKILELAGKKTPVVPISSKEFPTPAKRPATSSLINTKLPPMRKWDAALSEYLSTR
jgi:dTDP-4-dehydrorhamnose reductase